MPSTSNLRRASGGDTGKRSANATLITHGLLLLDPLLSELFHQEGYVLVTDFADRKNDGEKGVCSIVGAPRGAFSRRPISGRRKNIFTKRAAHNDFIDLIDRGRTAVTAIMRITVVCNSASTTQEEDTGVHNNSSRTTQEA